MNLPEALVNAVSLSPHNKEGSYSATTLLKGIREILLEKRHWQDIEIDVSDNIWALFGTAVHSVLENQKTSEFKEELFSAEVSKSKVTGRADSYCLENEILTDYKTASTWKVRFADFSDWKKQGLIYAWLMRENGLTVKKCRFIALLKDHSKTQAKREQDYPQSPVYVYEFDVTEKELEETEKLILEKIASIEKNIGIQDDDLPECTAEERWATQDKFAVMKEGRKTAVRVFDTKDEAEEKLAELDKKHYIEYRKGESKKCADYCYASAFCNQWQKEKEETNG